MYQYIRSRMRASQQALRWTPLLAQRATQHIPQLALRARARTLAMSSSESDDDDPVEFLRSRRRLEIVPPVRAEPEPEQNPEPEPEPEPRIEEPAVVSASPQAVARPQHSNATTAVVPRWLASLPGGKVGPSGKVDFAYHSLDDSSIVRAVHWLLAQRRFVRSLHLQCNSITVLSDWVGQLTAIEELHLSHNRLESLPSSLGRLVSLRTLCVDHNRLTALPECLRLLDKLETVEVEGNPLVSPPIEVCRNGIHAINGFFSRQMEARQRLAFVCASHARLGVSSPAGRRNLSPQTLACIGRSGVLGGVVFVRWQRGVARRSEEEAGRTRAGAVEVQESRQQLLTAEAAGWLTKQVRCTRMALSPHAVCDRRTYFTRVYDGPGCSRQKLEAPVVHALPGRAVLLRGCERSVARACASQQIPLFIHHGRVERRSREH